MLFAAEAAAASAAPSCQGAELQAGDCDLAEGSECDRARRSVVKPITRDCARPIAGIHGRNHPFNGGEPLSTQPAKVHRPLALVVP